MATISERLRARTYQRWSSDVQAVEEFEDELCTEAAATIDALVMALETVSSDEGHVQLSDDTWFVVQVALIQARKVGW